MRIVLVEAAIVVAVLPPLKLTLEVVVPWRAVPVAGGLAPILDDFLHPPFLCIGSGIHSLIVMPARVVDAGGNVITFCFEDIR